MTISPEARPSCTHVGHGVRICLDWDYHRLAHAAARTIDVLTAEHPRAAALYTRLLTDSQALALWDLTAYITIEKLGYNDHGQMHAQMVTANALQLLHYLTQAGVEPDVVDSGAGTLDDAYVVVMAAALLHDVGNQIAREGHETYSVILAQPVLRRHVSELYPDPVQAQVLTGFALSAIASHDCTPAPTTIEGAIVALADGADMAHGRGQVAFDQGKADIHAISAMAVRDMTIRAGEDTPVHIEVTMDNPAGLFQVERLLGRKLLGAGLEPYVSLRACVAPSGGEADQQTTYCLELRDGHFQPEEPSTPIKAHWPVDPVCGMSVAPQQSAGSIRFQGIQYYFCSADCLTHFRDGPTIYV